jgi:hypothetical protein
MEKKQNTETKKMSTQEVKKKTYEPPMIEEHDALDKVSACSAYSRAYVSGYGYWY